MKKRIPEIVIVIFSLVVLYGHVSNWIRGQDRDLLLLQQLTVESVVGERPLITARKAHAAFYLDCRMIKMPDDIPGKEFIPWCKEHGVHYVFWGPVERQSRRNLADYDWTRHLQIVWNKQDWAFIGRIRYE